MALGAVVVKAAESTETILAASAKVSGCWLLLGFQMCFLLLPSIIWIKLCNIVKILSLLYTNSSEKLALCSCLESEPRIIIENVLAVYTVISWKQLRSFS